MQQLRELRLWLLGAAALAVLLVFTRCGGREDAEADAQAALQRARIDTLRQATVRRQARIDSLERAARATDAPHRAAIASTQAAERDAETRLRSVRRAIANDSLTIAAAKLELEQLATSTQLLLVRVRLERAAAGRRIEAYDVAITYVQRSAPVVDSLLDAQADRIRTLERGRPWWRRAFAAVCEGGAVGTGAGGGAAIAGPPGAIGGALAGWITGRVACP
jgi:hypothetical protein